MNPERQEQQAPERDVVPIETRGGDRAHPRRIRGATLPAFLSGLQLLIIIPFAVLVVVSVGAFVYAGYLAVLLVFGTSWGSSTVSANVVKALQVIDVSLIGIAALVIAADALVIFMGTSRGARVVPRWLEQETVEVLKNRALAMVVLILAVTFLEGIVRGNSGSHELDLGFSIAAVIAAIGVYLIASRLKMGGPPPGGSNSGSSRV